MSKLVFLVGFTGLTMVAGAGAACSSSTGSDGDSTLPQRTEAGTQAETSTSADAAPAESCKDLALVVGVPAICDECAKAKCCTEVLACTKSADCAALQMCIDPCAQDDFICIGTCTEAHGKGTSLLQEVGSCAQTSCKKECAGSEPADAGFDTGL